ncbi:hypothetical protein N7451_005354 [Penicillium sp. IBT 35674x]|nr:hypothetical protein N7451_005354 [Penicillium sp. IBT 35674x]
MTSINFDGHNLGFQAGVMNGSVSTDNITTVRPLANSLFKSLFNYSELFGQIRDKLGLLVAVLDATEEHAQGLQKGNEQLSGLDEALGNCHSALDDLSRLKAHFDGVTAQTQVTWERMGWADDELTDLSSKLTTYISGLNVLNDNIIPSSHEHVERMLKDFMNEIRAGKRTSLAISCASTGSLSADEKEQWKQLRKELQSIGITPEIFAHNREYILNILRALSQDEVGCSPVSLVAVEKQESAPGPLHDVADDSSRSESRKEIFAPGHTGDIPNDCSESTGEGYSISLPPIRSNGTDLYTSPFFPSINQAPREEKSDEWTASSVSSGDSPVARNIGKDRRPSRSLINFVRRFMSSNPKDDGHVNDGHRPASSHAVAQPSERTRYRFGTSHEDLEPSSWEEWAYILRFKDLKKKGKQSWENWSVAGGIGPAGDHDRPPLTPHNLKLIACGAGSPQKTESTLGARLTETTSWLDNCEKNRKEEGGARIYLRRQSHDL